MAVLATFSHEAMAAPSARDKKVARQEYKRGKRSFEKQDYRKALQHYQRAYKHLPLSGLLFNIAQCHRNLGELVEARRFFRLYLSKQPNAANRQAVEALLRDLNRAMEKRAAENRAAENRAAEKRAAEKQAADKREADKREAEKRATDKRASDKRAADKKQRVRKDLIGSAPPKSSARPIYKKWWFWTGIVAVVGGGVAGIYLATRSGDDFPDTHLPIVNADK